MKTHLKMGIGLPAAVVATACLAGSAAGQDHMISPLASTPNAAYVTGNKVNQIFLLPDQDTSNVVDATASGGNVSAFAASSHIATQANNRTRMAKQLTQHLRGQTRVRLDRSAMTAQGAVAAIAPEPTSLYKFTYSYHYKGVPLWRHSSQSQLIHAKGDTRRLLYVRERNTPKLDQLGETVPTVKDEDATKLALDDSKAAIEGAIAVDAKNEKPHPEIHVDPAGKPTLAWSFVVRSNDRTRPYARRYWVAARDDARILDKEDLIYHAGPPATVQTGKVLADIIGFDKSPLDPVAKGQPLNDYTVFDNGTTVITGADGSYTSHGSGLPNFSLIGPYCRIINEANAGKLLMGVLDNDNILFKVKPNDEFELAQTTAFKWVSTAHAFVKDFLPTPADRLVSLPTHVNIKDNCNAFFDPNDHTLNFFQKTKDKCVNSAFCDVVCHEFGHAVDDQFGDILDGGYSEGFGDSLAILITRNPVIGRDFFGPGTSLRDARIVSPLPTVSLEVHEVGKTYGGFTWELIQQLFSKLGSEDKAYDTAKQLVIGAAALNPADTVDAVRLSFLIDSQNGSPFFKELAAAADSRNIPRPDSPATAASPAFLANGTK